jgi:serine/threonine-protein kinase
VPFPYSAEVLATKAQEMLARLGYPERPTDSGYGFQSDSSYPRWLEKRDTSSGRWRQLASVRPPAVCFWYRTSPQRMTPQEFLNGRAGLVLGANDPPRTLPGMTFISLDLSGRLTHLEAIMPDRETEVPAAGTPDWSRLFAEAGLDKATFRSVAPEWKGPAGADARAAWIGPGADASGAELRVEAAAHRGRPMFFSLISPWTEPADVVAAQDSLEAADIVAFTLLVTVLGFAILLAIRNIRSSRADSRGAMRLAVAVGLAMLASGLLESRIALSPFVDLSTLVTVISGAAFYGVMTWTLYVALEPHARRRWPQMLVSWSRLLEGRWRDPLVGRDLLVGGTIGMALHLMLAIHELFKASPQSPVLVANTWMGLREALAGIPYLLPQSVWVAFWMLLLLVVLRIVLRREWLAMAAFVVLLSAVDIVAEPSPANIALLLASDAILVVTATRFGLLSVFALLASGPLVFRYGASLTPPAPLVGLTMLGLVAVLAPGVFGFFTSRARRATGTGKWLDE